MIDPVLMYYPTTPANTTYVERDSYRNTWFDLGWRSDDDPTFLGNPGSGTDIRQFITYPKGGGLRQWSKARNLSTSRLVRIAWWGASTGVGERASNQDTKGFRGLVDARLRSLLGDGGSGFMGGNMLVTGTAGSGPVTTTGTWTQEETEGGVTKRSMRPTTPATPGATITFPGVRGRFIDVFFKSNTGWGSWTWTIAGVSQTALNMNQAAAIRTVTVDMGTSASRTVVFTQNGDGRLYGVRGRNATGYIGENLCVPGQKTSDLSIATTLLDNTDPTENSMVGRTLETIGPVDVAIIFLMGNEAVATDAASEEALWAGLEMLTYNLITGGPTQSEPADKIVINEHFGAIDTIPGFGFFNRDAVMLSSFNRDYADSVAAVHIDVWAAYKQSWQFGVDENLFGSGPPDAVHPGDFGHSKIADAILTALRVPLL